MKPVSSIVPVFLIFHIYIKLIYWMMIVIAIAVHAPNARVSLDDLKEHLPAMREAAVKISELECQQQED